MSDSMEISQSDVSCEGAVDASKTFFDLDQYVNRSDMELLSNFNEMVENKQYNQAVAVGELIESTLGDMLLGSGLDIETQCGFYIDYCACIFILGCVWNDHAKPSEAQDINDNRLKQVLSRIPPYCTAKLGTQATHTGECLIKIVNSLTNYCKTKSHRDLLVELINVANAEPNSVISKICTPMIQHLRMYQYVYISVMYHIISLSEVSAMVQLPQEQVLKDCREHFGWPCLDVSTEQVEVYPASILHCHLDCKVDGAAGSDAVSASEMLKEIAKYIAYFESRNPVLDVLISTK